MQPCRKLTAMTCNHCSGARGFLDREAMSRAVPEGLKGGPNDQVISWSFRNFPLQVGMI